MSETPPTEPKKSLLTKFREILNPVEGDGTKAIILIAVGLLLSVPIQSVFTNTKFTSVEISVLFSTALAIAAISVARSFFNYLDPPNETKRVGRAFSGVPASSFGLLDLRLVDSSAFSEGAHEKAHKEVTPIQIVTDLQLVIERRLIREMEDLARRANIGLGVGILFSLIGISVVAIGAFLHNSVVVTNQEIATKLSVSAFLQVIAFFFLRLYRSSIQEIKYYQNELTNVQQRFQGIILATSLGSEESLDTLIATLGSTERNRILEKGQTSVGIEGSSQLLERDFDMIGRAVVEASEKAKKR